jgi:hypothetical protein
MSRIQYEVSPKTFHLDRASALFNFLCAFDSMPVNNVARFIF